MELHLTLLGIISKQQFRNCLDFVLDPLALFRLELYAISPLILKGQTMVFALYPNKYLIVGGAFCEVPDRGREEVLLFKNISQGFSGNPGRTK